MLDFVLGAVLIALAVRGWMRGFVREVIGLGVVIVGLFLAFRLSTPLGGVVESMAGTSPDVSRLVAGIFVVLVLSIGAAVVARMLHAGLRMVPGLTTLNRAAGAVFSVVAGAFVVFVAVSILALLPVPEPIDDALDGSAIASYITDPEAAPQRALGVIAGDRVIASILAIQELVGERRIVGPDRGEIEIPAAQEAEIKATRRAADRLYDLLNRERVRADASPLLRSEVLDDLALVYATDLYVSGRLADTDAAGVRLRRRLATAGVTVSAADQLTGLASSPKSLHQGWVLDAPSHREMVDRNHVRVGIAVVKGPLGLLAVQVLTN